MSALSAAALLPSIVSSPSIAGTLPEGDRRLIDLAQRISELQALYDAAFDREGKAWDAFEACLPRRPRELQWNMCDPVGYEIERTDEGRGTPWCRIHEIRKLRSNPLVKYQFAGTNAEWGDDASHRFNEGKPVHEVAHLWRAVPDKKARRRAGQLVAALERWEAEQDRLAVETGARECERQSSELHDQIWTLQQEMLSLPAVTLEGVRAKAMVLFQVCWLGDTADHLGDAMDSKFIYSIVADLGGGEHPAPFE